MPRDLSCIVACWWGSMRPCLSCFVSAACRGHLGGLVGGALASYLLGPKLRIGGLRGQRGQFLLDDPPVPILATPPRQYRG